MKPFICMFLLLAMPAYSCELVMGYRTTARLPKINAAPDNSGLYFDLYQQVAQNIGCTLKIMRKTKKRILRGLEAGTIDFYPGMTYTEPRSKKYFFIPNGLLSWDVILTRVKQQEITQSSDLAGMIFLRSLGSPVHLSIVGQKGLIVRIPPELDIEQAINLILARKADFYFDGISTLTYYLRNFKRKDELRLHLGLTSPSEITAGFSRQSKHYEEEANPKYQPSLAIHYSNFPTRIKKGSKAHQFQEELQLLKNNNFTDNTFNRYYGVSVKKMQDKLKNRDIQKEN